jgi:hypothetical protein
MPDLINEEFAAQHFLSAAGIAGESLKQRDKPDFVFQNGDQMIGLEVCNASPEEYQRVTKVLHHRQWGESVFAGNLQHRDERRTTSELITETTNPNILWQDNEQIHGRWRMGIERLLREKERAFTNAGFHRFDQNWLLIYDLEIAPIAHRIDLQLVRSSLQFLGAIFHPPDYFDKVWIDLGRGGIVEWTIPRGVITWKQPPN